MRRAFVSYARDDKCAVVDLVGHLSVLSIQSWFDSALHGGQDWWASILDEIAKADVFVAVVSEASLRSVACEREFAWAKSLGKAILPIAIQQTPRVLPGRLANIQIVDYHVLDHAAALRLAGALIALPTATALPSTLPEPPLAPLSYLTGLTDLIGRASRLEETEQIQIVSDLRPALHSADPEERLAALELLRRFQARSDILAFIERMLVAIGVPESETEPEADAGEDAATATPPSEPDEKAVPGRPDAAAAEHGTPPTRNNGPTTTARYRGPQRLPIACQKPWGIAVSRHGTVYVADLKAERVFVLAKGSDEPTSLATALSWPRAVATDGDDSLYVASGYHGRVVRVCSGAAHRAIEFGELDSPSGLAVSRETVVVSDTGRSRVLTMAPTARRHRVAKFTDLKNPGGVAVDRDGNIYVADTGNARVLRLDAATQTQTLVPFTRLSEPSDVAVGPDGTVFVADPRGVFGIEPEADQHRLPFSKDVSPKGIAVDGQGDVYITDWWKPRVLKLSRRRS